MIPFLTFVLNICSITDFGCRSTSRSRRAVICADCPWYTAYGGIWPLIFAYFRNAGDVRLAGFAELLSGWPA